MDGNKAANQNKLIIAERAGRACYGMELDEGYASVIVERWQRETNQSAVLLSRNGVPVRDRCPSWYRPAHVCTAVHKPDAH
jgi:hypothetical protein